MTFKCVKIWYDYRLLSLLNFPGAAILNFVTCNGWRFCYSAEVLLCETILKATVLCHEIQDGGAREI